MTAYLRSTTPPRYTPQDVELARLDSTSPSILSAPPPYDEAVPSSSSPFNPTVHLQIETPGKPWFSLPLPPRPDPIPIFTLHPEDSSSSAAAAVHTPTFTSLRPERASGSCYLLPTATTATSPTEAFSPLSTTTYRFGPNRPPRVRLFAPHSEPLNPSTLHHLLFCKDDSNHDDEEALGVRPWDDFTVTSLGLLTRSVSLRTRLGTFQWRYASRRERASAGRTTGHDISSLLVLERVVRVARARNVSSSPNGGGSSGKDDEEIRTTVAHLLRGPGLRAEGSTGSSAGNGGRLVIDLGFLDRDGDLAEGKVEREMAVVMVVTTCLVMLKREVDRRRAQQIAIMAGGAGGGS
ncbi:hypothetical protein VTI74DRAFT_2512 [Chaetomium olivicolor]